MVKSLEEGDKRPLFAPDTLYTVTVGFKAQLRKADDPSHPKTRDLTQQLRFRTAATAPPRLDPWVLATVPENDAGSHFCEDPVQFIFNDTRGALYGAFARRSPLARSQLATPRRAAHDRPPRSAVRGWSPLPMR